MEDILEAALALGDGIVYRRDLIGLGATRGAIDRLVASGALRPLRTGAYLPRDSPTEAPWVYRTRVVASIRLGSPDRIVSHASAAALHGLPMIGAWPRTLHVSDPSATGGSSSALVTRHRAGAHLPTTRVDGILVTTIARTAADLARTQPFATAVAVVDDALRRGIPKSVLLRELSDSAASYGMSRAQRAIDFGDARAASAGESLSRARVHELGFVVPELQVPFVDTRGVHREVDFFWTEERKIGEFDGLHKYARDDLTGGEPPAAVVIREKLREDALRPPVASFDRWVWDDAISPRRFHRFLRDRGMPLARRR